LHHTVAGYQIRIEALRVILREADKKPK